ncbi:hypothetical protein Tco_1435203 [Tanacetum coccineum]
MDEDEEHSFRGVELEDLVDEVDKERFELNLSAEDPLEWNVTQVVSEANSFPESVCNSPWFNSTLCVWVCELRSSNMEEVYDKILYKDKTREINEDFINQPISEAFSAPSTWK